MSIEQVICVRQAPWASAVDGYRSLGWDGDIAEKGQVYTICERLVMSGEFAVRFLEINAGSNTVTACAYPESYFAPIKDSSLDQFRDLVRPILDKQPVTVKL